MKLKLILTYIFLLCSLTVTSSVFAGNNNQIDKMQEHWEMITSEKDTSKIKKMIDEHKTMMNEIEKSSGGHHMGNMSGSHMDMNNMIDMHRSMIQIME